MPSCAAGPVSATDWPSTILSLVTPTSAAIAPDAASAAKLAMVVLTFMAISSLRDCQELLLLNELRDIQLLPALPVLVFVLGLDPNRGATLGAHFELRGVAQPERAVDQQRRAHAEALADQQQARMLSERYA